MRKALAIIAGIVLASAALYGGGRAFAAASQGYSWGQMDWNADGRTTAGEFFAAADTGKRELCQDGRNCTEFFAYRDGVSVRLDCR